MHFFTCWLSVAARVCVRTQAPNKEGRRDPFLPPSGKLRQQRREKKRGLSVYHHHQPLLYYVAWKEERGGDLLFPPEEKGRKDSRTKGGRRKEIMKDTQGEETEETEVKKWATFCSGAPRNRLLHFAQLQVFCAELRRRETAGESRIAFGEDGV